MFIDTHCHLDAAEFGADQAELVSAANAAGVSRIVVPSVERANFATVAELCQGHATCFPAFGIHPMYVDNATPEDLPVLREYLTLPHTVAVGEIGLDFFVEHYDRARQEFFFVEQLKLAKEFDLPVLLHLRRAQDIVLKYLRQHRVCGGIAHAFNGSHQQAEEFIKLGFKLGFGGAMTYPRALRLRELAATLPLESIVLETDAPDIPPAFLEHGQPNRPEYLARIATTLAELRGLSIEQVAQATSQNTFAALPRLSQM
ncbi:putative metal-dependent hydrolase YjjV [Ferriphaselus amnicola]|uniref:Putative metal-dependent hydrolase YjjV n=1 Tax=Ferriphaselus amnicola TaxID=1188319 RepID=A0A2Z6G8Q8_9PROT|nr:TatD family hydrolase [Ferriphaselus amnicola]BBE49852.1 putative metal-dependent hydrolase YjjV [Ferriphaselus amnicola]